MSTAWDWVAGEPYGEVGHELRLLGARCRACALTTYPGQRGCPRCGTETMERRVLANHGTLWSYTVQYFPPKASEGGPRDPADFQPYGVGYIQLEDDVIVEARLTENNPAALEIGMAMQLVTPPTRLRDDRAVIGSLRFRPLTYGEELP